MLALWRKHADPRVIELPQIVAKILIHLALWPASAHSPPVAGSPVPVSLQRVAAA